jgi:hypothetical protein
VLEDPVRHWSWLAAKARRGLVMGGGLIAASITTAVIVVTNAPPLVGAGSAAAPVVITASTTLPPPGSIAPAGVSYPEIPTPSPAASPPGAPGAAAAPTLPPASSTTVPGPDELAAANQPQLVASLRTRAAPSNLRPSVRQARNDLPAIYHDGCHLDPAVTEPPTCAFGDTASPTTVVLFGDSHAAQWFPALDDIARRHHWRLEVMTKKGCPTANISVFSPTVNRELKECDAWRLNVGTRLSAERPALIVMSSYRYRQVGAWAGIDADTAWRRGFGATMAAFRPLARQVLVLGDTPTPARDIPSCVSSHLGDVSACTTTRSEAVKDDRLAIEREVAAHDGARFVSTSEWLCSPAACPVVVGDVLLYRDANHLTATAARWLEPYVDAAVMPLVP